MKILYLAHRIPYPPNKGDKIRSFHEIMHLSRKHEVHLVAFCDQPGDMKYSAQLERYCRSVTLISMNPWVKRLKAAAAMLTGRPFSLGYFDSGPMKEAVQTKLAEHRFDLIFVYCSSVAPYVESVTGIPKILDFVDSDACKWSQYAAARKGPMKWVYGLEAQRLKRYESRMIDEFDLSAFVSEREADHLPEEQRNKVLYVQNGIDLNFYRPEKEKKGSRDIVFTGVMDYFPNVDAVTFFAHEVFPTIRKRFPDTRFLIVGSNPTAAVRKLAAIPGIVVTGTVSDVRPYVSKAHVSVAPLRISQGIQNKILQALAAGLPVVASPNAAAGLTHLTGVSLVIADNPAAFAASVCDFLNQPLLSDREVDLCREQLKEHYHWPRNLDAFEKAIKTLTSEVDATLMHTVGALAACLGGAL